MNNCENCARIESSLQQARAENERLRKSVEHISGELECCWEELCQHTPPSIVGACRMERARNYKREVLASTGAAS